MVNKVACFLTCGYTEAGEMQSLLRRCCSSNTRFVQCMPNKPKRRKRNGSIIKDEFSGLTHDGLVNKALEIIRMNKEQYINYRGIVFEDDLDNLTQDDANTQANRIRGKIKDILGDIPVVIVYAAPEVEAWFIADWDHGFGIYRRPELLKAGFSVKDGFFLDHHMRGFFKEIILGEYADKIEEYGTQVPYKKLSDEIIMALDSSVEQSISCSFRRYIKEKGSKNPELAERFIECKNLRYSKKETGSLMLRNLDPAVVADNCQLYFAKAYREIQSFEHFWK